MGKKDFCWDTEEQQRRAGQRKKTQTAPDGGEGDGGLVPPAHLVSPHTLRWQGRELGREGETRAEGTRQHRDWRAMAGESLQAALWSVRQKKRLVEMLREVYPQRFGVSAEMQMEIMGKGEGSRADLLEKLQEDISGVAAF